MNSKNLKKIYEILEQHDIEIVSYGLAPNPNGFCYEVPTETRTRACVAACSRLNKLLDALSSAEEKELRELEFGRAK